jgi:hypothetical protein
LFFQKPPKKEEMLERWDNLLTQRDKIQGARFKGQEVRDKNVGWNFSLLAS